MFKQLLTVAGFALLLAGCGDGPANDAAATAADSTAQAEPPVTGAVDNDFIIVPGTRVGPIQADSDQAGIRAMFGQQNVREANIYVGEGFERPGLLVYPGSQDEVEVLWVEGGDPQRPELVFIRQDGSQWRTESGVSIGTTLEELQQLNGKPFKLSGFDWDYGGTITDWNGGKLEGLTLRLNYPDGKTVDNALLGDQIISSDHPAFAELGAYVNEIVVALNRPRE